MPMGASSPDRHVDTSASKHCRPEIKDLRFEKQGREREKVMVMVMVISVKYWQSASESAEGQRLAQLPLPPHFRRFR
jgi:hypothetical protein